ncbi:tail protein [Lactobacillus phage Semele]|uniref:Tail protein n=1 Tax=Lactobacillus phage Semele TaxID=2079433 RepID=A0A2K9VDD0_9CAUD|nr:tail fiber protein [Lactobacillus phage Semele]AUV60228.1 tail protein [Lactobacillus phage Semele]
MADISIPEGDNPVRYQASLGGNQKYRNMGNVSGQAYLVRGQVTNVYYQKGTLDFNTYGSSVTSGVTDGSGSAPIPVDFWGKNTDGKVFGCYRPVQKGSQILVAYIGGDTSRPIVIGVYPDNEASYELISPVHYNTGDDSTDDVQNDALGERKIYPNQQMMYESGKGDILRSMGGKSFLYISENGSGYLDDINYAYDEIRDFYDADANEIEPTMTKAQSWLLVHEDNDSDESADGHRTRFYVNRSGELMVTFANKEDPNNIVVLEASKDSGFKLTKRFDSSNLKEESEDYVQFGIGNGNNVSIKSVDSGDATSFYLDNGNIKLDTPKEGSITLDGISVNAILGRVSDAENAANNASDKADNAAIAGERAESAASDAASQALAASQAGEDAKSAAVEAKAAGEDAKNQAKDTQDRIIYYASISNETDVAVPGKYIIVNTDTYIANGTIKTAHIADAAITTAKIALAAIGTAQIEDAAVTKAKIGNLAVGTAQIEDAAITDAKVGNLSADHLNAGTIDFSVINGTNINASNITVGKLVANQLEIKSLDELSNNLGTIDNGTLGNINNWGSVKLYADVYAHTFSNLTGTFTADANGAVVASNLTIRGVTNLVYNAALLGGSGTNIPGWNLFAKGYLSNFVLHDGVPSIGFSSSTGSGTWVDFAQSKLYPLNGLTGQPYSASVWFVEAGSEAAMKYQFTLAFFDSNGNRISSAVAANTWNGNPTAQGWAYKTINNIVSPSTAVYVAIQYWAYNGTGHALFSSPMLTQTAQSTGYQPDTGNIVSAGIINGSTINGSTINGTTFNGGDRINNANNTSNFHPFTIEPNGKASTTLFNSMDALRTEMSGGGLRTMYRAINASGSQYEAYDGNFSGDTISLNSGFTNGKDMSFSQSVSGSQLTGQVVISPLNGLHLWGSTQSIHFSGLQMNGTGITFNSYGNIIADQASTWWRVTNFSGNDIANFGTDTSGNNPIQFNRELDIGNFQINTGHTFTSADNGAFHFAMGKGGSADIYAGAVNYTSLVKSSLLSVKRDVQKADTAYWAQLVNSIDLATYQYKSDDNTSQIRLSSIVDDVNDTKQWRLPDVFINRDEDGKLNGVDDSVLLNATLATVQEQQKEIDQLNGHNMELEARLNKLEVKLNG